MGGKQRMYFLTPMFEPVGGVVKVFDYVNHAVALGYEPIIACPERYREGLPLFENRRFSNLTPENGIKYIDLEQVSLGPDDLAFLTWPTHYGVVERRMSRWTQHEQVIQIVQNVRWANPAFAGGYAVRVLSRPMARIMTNDVVLEAVKVVPEPDFAHGGYPDRPRRRILLQKPRRRPGLAVEDRLHDLEVGRGR